MAKQALGNALNYIEKPSLLDVMASEGIQLRQKGKDHWACCPLHNEKTPSCKVTGERWHCFGCNEGGDVISLVQKIHKLSFTEALEHLDITKSKPDVRVLREAQKKRIEDERIAKRMRWYYRTLCKRLRRYERIVSRIRSWRSMEDYSWVMHKLAPLGYLLDRMVHVIQDLNHGPLNFDDDRLPGLLMEARRELGDDRIIQEAKNYGAKRPVQQASAGTAGRSR